MALLQKIRRMYAAPTVEASPVPVATTVPTEDEFSVTEYQKLAERAGFVAGARLARRERFKRFMAENGVTVYSTPKVAEYLHAVCPRGHRVVWLSVNEDDGQVIGMNITGEIWLSHVGGDTRGIYEKPLPIPVLHTMCKFTESGGEFKDVTFYASDFTDVPKGDPFLAVLMGDEVSAGEFFVIERWDEPGFRG